MYKLHKNIEGSINSVVITNGDVTISIPLTDPANTDYQAYLKWLAQGNQPLPADEGEQ